MRKEYRAWTPEDIQRVKEDYLTIPLYLLEKAMGRDQSSITRWAKKLGLYPKKSHKGHLRPLGDRRLQRGVLYQKVSLEKGTSSRNWKPLHKIMWIEKYGEIPKTHICTFKPGMRESFNEQPSLEKVHLVSRKEMSPMVMFKGQKKLEIYMRSVETRKRNKEQIKFARERDERIRARIAA